MSQDQKSRYRYRSACRSMRVKEGSTGPDRTSAYLFLLGLGFLPPIFLRTPPCWRYSALCCDHVVTSSDDGCWRACCLSGVFTSLSWFHGSGYDSLGRRDELLKESANDLGREKQEDLAAEAEKGEWR